jgi:hypothetical protein
VVRWTSLKAPRWRAHYHSELGLPGTSAQAKPDFSRAQDQVRPPPGLGAGPAPARLGTWVRLKPGSALGQRPGPDSGPGPALVGHLRSGRSSSTGGPSPQLSILFGLISNVLMGNIAAAGAVDREFGRRPNRVGLTSRKLQLLTTLRVFTCVCTQWLEVSRCHAIAHSTVPSERASARYGLLSACGSSGTANCVTAFLFVALVWLVCGHSHWSEAPQRPAAKEP